MSIHDNDANEKTPIRLSGHAERWAGCVSLGEYVFKMVENGLAQAPEFKALVRVYGREKLLALYAKEKARRVGVK